MLEKVNEIHDFWFGTHEDELVKKAKKWWISDSHFDMEIKEKFQDIYNLAISGELDIWRTSPKSCLAYIILIDQFSRNLNRGKSTSFEFDDMALAASLRGIELKLDKELPLIERLFFYMPLEHSENIVHQKESLVHFKVLLEEAKSIDYTHLKIIKEAYEFAIKHYEVINFFGRFPHRNQVLNRKSTNDEKKYLEKFPKGF